MFAVHAYKSYSDEINPLILMTQFLSVLRFKKNNPSYKFKLYTDSKTLSIYKKYGIDSAYDSINTIILDNYPSDRISPKMWASPKLWVMKHINEPFIMVDADLIWHGVVEDYLDYDLSYLHLESPLNYVMPNRLRFTNGFSWDTPMLEGFSQSLPMNCALCIWNNVEILRGYVNLYFDAVLDSNISYVSSDGDEFFIHRHGLQTTMEQWMLSAYSYYFDTKVSNIKTHSILDMMAYTEHLTSYNPNLDRGICKEDASTKIFHLWGAKVYFQDGEYEKHESVVWELQTALEQIIDNDYHQSILDTLLQSLPQIPK